MIMYNKITKRISFNLFGINIKFQLPLKAKNIDERFENLLYELADPRTLKNVKLPQIMDLNTSLDFIINSNRSLARFGDGEFKLMFGESINFQKYDRLLEKRLKEIIKNNNENLTVGLPDTFGYCESEYFRKLLACLRKELYKFINFDTTYCNAFITRQFKFENKQDGEIYYKKFKRLWNNKEIVIIEGKGTYLGIGNDLFSNAASIKRIVCPNKDAFSKYQEILSEAMKQSKNKLFLLALGPTATVLADELSKNGFRAVDIGHIDIMYEMFLRGAKRLVPLENKIVFNKERKDKKFERCTDEKYYQEVIADLT